LTQVGIVAALAAEARVLGYRGARGAGPMALGDSLVMVSGIGCEAAANAARALIDAGATTLMSWGLAGGLDPAMRAGSIFLPHEIISRDGVSLRTASDWREQLRRAVAAQRPIAWGKLLTSPQAIVDVAGKAAAFRDTGAAAVDMESLAVAQIAAARELPFVAVRVIVDTAADALPACLVAASRSGELRLARLIAALAMAPSDLMQMLRLARRFRAARRSLSAVARAGSLIPLASAAPDAAIP